jgi:primosomal protein N' (replication factor Y) (superfamily II helicase)
MNFVRVALDLPVSSLFDYRAPDVDEKDIGQRVLVPFGKKILVGVIIEIARTTSLPSHRVRSVLEVLREIPPLPANILSLLKFCGSYYHHPLGETVLNALPLRLRQRQRVASRGDPHQFRLSPLGRSINPEDLPKRSTLKIELLHRLRESACGIEETTLIKVAPRARAALKALIDQSWIERIPVDSFVSNAPSPRAPGFALSAEQQIAVDNICSRIGEFAPWLLLGITGSGKTAVYLEIIAATLAAERQVLVLVPEINITPQLEARVRERFPAIKLAVLHSGLGESERLRNWLAAQTGVAGIVIGTRLSVFTPMPKLGLIVVDEEHDDSFKQSSGLRYSARDVALMRAKQLSIPIVLGSATPALETFHQALRGRYRLLSLTHRISATLPEIECVDTRREAMANGLSQPLLAAMRDTLRNGEQSLVFINRRGYAPVLICSSCHWISGCHRCAAKLVLHLDDGRLRCHHCGHQERVPETCPQCGNRDLAPLGQGTQRVESALRKFFPDARILRIDRDSTRRQHAWRDMREQIHAGEIDILVGTQMLAKSHDFPRLTLVGVVNSDASLYSTDFRASERLFSGLTQIAGRAGRAERPGRVLIQTEFPAHPLYQALRANDYAAFAHEILAERKQAGFPPYTHQAILRAEASRLDTALAFLGRAALGGRKFAMSVMIYDPVPAGMPRLGGVERAQLTVQSGSRNVLQSFLRSWRPSLDAIAARTVRWALDVDPRES